ncbi:hypothetical protein WI372_17015 [Gemmatimonadota bacterium DH-20]|uniref:Serine protease n=1 Tax=Gaopeijia maritima TaxID=3119007 RepID=A0ABU9EEW5_9BACT
MEATIPTETELRLALGVVTEGADLRTPPGMPERWAGEPRFRQECARVEHEARPWVQEAGVQGLGVGEKVVAGRGTGRLALRVYVDAKRPRDALRHPVPPAVALPEVGVCPTDVHAIGRLRPEVFAERVRPAMPGCGIGHPDGGTGTFGCLVREAGNDRDLFLLSNAHVVADDGCAHPGDPILQPARADGGRVDRDTIAEFARAHPFVFSDTGFPNTMDAAIARVLDPALVESVPRSLDRPIRGVARTLRRGMEVQKVGRTTDHTLGLTLDVDFRFQMPYKRPGHRSAFFDRAGHTDTGRAGFRDQVLCTRYTDQGDSGAAVLNRRGYLLGLHFAGSPAASVFSPIRPVLRALGLRLHRS